ncbi:MAG TPA: hypothetical protein VGO37_21625 [Steroidobacteraceae bacterium]|nr:hypothetical protein [Steroidobacteraceae bacterium]
MHNHAVFAARLALLTVRSVAAILLLPSMVSAESHIQAVALNDAPTATARVNFKIVIPRVLYVRLGTGNDRAVGAETVAIMSNSRNVTLNATIRTPGSSAQGNVILSSALGNLIAQDAACTLGPSRVSAAPAQARRAGTFAVHQVFCTVSMP